MTVISSAVSVSLRTGASAARLTAKAERGCDGRAAESDEQDDQPQAAEHVVHLRRRAPPGAIPDEIGTVTGGRESRSP